MNDCLGKSFMWLNFFLQIEAVDKLDQYQYLGNCPPTPPLTQH